VTWRRWSLNHIVVKCHSWVIESVGSWCYIHLPWRMMWMNLMNLSICRFRNGGRLLSWKRTYIVGNQQQVWGTWERRWCKIHRRWNRCWTRIARHGWILIWQNVQWIRMKSREWEGWRINDRYLLLMERIRRWQSHWKTLHGHNNRTLLEETHQYMMRNVR
jgi:hypothetical protein